MKLDLYVALSYVIVVLSYSGRQKRVGHFRTKGGVISSFVQKVCLIIYFLIRAGSSFRPKLCPSRRMPHAVTSGSRPVPPQRVCARLLHA